MTRSAPRILVATAIALALSACAPTPAAEPSRTPSSASTPSSTPAATPTLTPAALPTDCAAVGTAETRAETVDLLMLQGDGTGFIRPAPASAERVLACNWFAGDASGVLLLVSRVDAAEAADFTGTLPGDGYTCTAGDAGDLVCRMVTPHPQYPVDTIETILSRDGVWIYLSATNVDGDRLLSDLNAQIWPPS